ncbi:hypothetical protein ACFE04_009832 [Oxalis oulophora]
MHGYSRLGTSTTATANGRSVTVSTTPSPPSSPRLHHGRSKLAASNVSIIPLSNQLMVSVSPHYTLTPGSTMVATATPSHLSLPLPHIYRKYHHPHISLSLTTSGNSLYSPLPINTPPSHSYRPVSLAAADAINSPTNSNPGHNSMRFTRPRHRYHHTTPSLLSSSSSHSFQSDELVIEDEEFGLKGRQSSSLSPTPTLTRSTMMSPKEISVDRGGGGGAHFRQLLPFQIIHVLGNLMRIWSIYSMYAYLTTHTKASVLLFIFTCLLPSSFFFLLLHKPWKGRPLPNTQVVPSVINGAITALYFILWSKGVKSCGPLRAIMAEYSGAVLGVLSAVLYGRRGHMWKKDNVETEVVQTEKVLSITDMIVPILAGILSALRRVIARRVSLKNQLKRRLNTITITSATCFLFPVAMWDLIMGSTSDNSEALPFFAWPFLSTILFGILLIFYVDSMAEERLHMVFSSPRQLMVAAGCIIVLEINYKMDFSLPGFLLCAIILGFGIYVATSLDRARKDSSKKSPVSSGIFEDEVEMPSLPT